MTNERQRHADTMRAIEASCIPLLCGDERRVYATARRLFRRYGLTSYALLPKNARRAGFLSRIFASPLVKIIPTACTSPDLLADTVIRFFGGMEETNALPVLIDCTDGAALLRDGSFKTALEAHCFVSDPAHLTEIPPFCYLEERGDDRDK